MKQYTSREEREHIERQFDDFMHRTIKNCVLNARKKIIRDENRHESISIETVDKDYIAKILTRSEYCDHEKNIVIEADFKIKISDRAAMNILKSLTDREAQVLILRVAYELDYDEIAHILQISPERARVIKCDGLKKAKVRAREYGSNSED